MCNPPSKPKVLGILNVGDGIMMVIMAGEFPWQWLISRKTRLFKLHLQINLLSGTHFNHTRFCVPVSPSTDFVIVAVVRFFLIAVSADPFSKV